MTKNTRFSPEVRQRAIRMVLESQDEYDSSEAGGNLLPQSKLRKRSPLLRTSMSTIAGDSTIT
ncbi:hypothetical protein, partial [Escherichia coli]|uniref:hypothetical protein n=1 Tax=Escherichia coli TaxID=562 RepID=UPI000A8702CB